MAYLFFKKTETHQFDSISSNDNLKTIFWKPTILNICPPGTSLLPFAIWWLFHYMHIFSNKEYCVCLILHNNTIVHKSLVTPKYFRFPFMSNNDLQIGDIWTDPTYREQGIATYAISQIFNHLSSPDVNFWYVAEEDNSPSIQLAKKLGFVLYGKGNRHSRYGIRLIGHYIIKNYLNAHNGR